MRKELSTGGTSDSCGGEAPDTCRDVTRIRHYLCPQPILMTPVGDGGGRGGGGVFNTEGEEGKITTRTHCMPQAVSVVRILPKWLLIE